MRMWTHVSGGFERLRKEKGIIVSDFLLFFSYFRKEIGGRSNHGVLPSFCMYDTPYDSPDATSEGLLCVNIF